MTAGLILTGGAVTIARNSIWAVAILAFFAMLPGIESAAEYELGRVEGRLHDGLGGEGDEELFRRVCLWGLVVVSLCVLIL